MKRIRYTVPIGPISKDHQPIVRGLNAASCPSHIGHQSTKAEGTYSSGLRLMDTYSKSLILSWSYCQLQAKVNTEGQHSDPRRDRVWGFVVRKECATKKRRKLTTSPAFFSSASRPLKYRRRQAYFYTKLDAAVVRYRLDNNVYKWMNWALADIPNW